MSDPIGDALRADANAYYKLEDVNDSTSHGLNLTNNGGAAFVSGKINNAVECAVTGNKYLSRANTSLLEGDTSFTVAGWFRFYAFKAGDNMAIIGKDGVNGGYYIYAFGYDPIINAYFTIVDGDYSSPIVLSSDFIVLDTWYFFTAQYDAVSKIITLRLNETVDQISDLFGENPSSTEPFVIGAISANDTVTNFSDVVIDELGFWKRLLTSDEIDYLYNSGAGRALFPAPEPEADPDDVAMSIADPTRGGFAVPDPGWAGRGRGR